MVPFLKRFTECRSRATAGTQVSKRSVRCFGVKCLSASQKYRAINRSPLGMLSKGLKATAENYDITPSKKATGHTPYKSY